MAYASKSLIASLPTAFIAKAILGAIASNVLLLSFILLRRMYRRRFFAKRDARVVEFRRNWDALLSGEIPYNAWRSKAFDLHIVETIVLDALEAADRQDATRLLAFLRSSGLIDRLIFDARQQKGWKRHRALVSLGRTRAPEGIPALAEALTDKQPETRLAAVRGLGRNACPEAGEELLNWVAETGLQVPALPLQTALVNCCTERPRILLPFLHNCDKAAREVIGRVLGEVATPALGSDLLQFVEDEQPELRAAAARALSCTQQTMAVDVLAQLANDSVWFVRLRAVVSLGNLGQRAAMDPLVRSISDPNRLVRLRAAEALLKVETDQVTVFQRVLVSKDKYALYAYLTALDNSGSQWTLTQEIENSTHISQDTRSVLLDVLRTGHLPHDRPGVPKVLAHAASQL